MLRNVVLDAINVQRERNGSTVRQIVDYLKDGPEASLIRGRILPRVKRTLDEAEKDGLVDSCDGKYILSPGNRPRGYDACIFGYLFGGKKPKCAQKTVEQRKSPEKCYVPIVSRRRSCTPVKKRCRRRKTPVRRKCKVRRKRRRSCVSKRRQSCRRSRKRRKICKRSRNRRDMSQPLTQRSKSAVSSQKSTRNGTFSRDCALKRGKSRRRKKRTCRVRRRKPRNVFQSLFQTFKRSKKQRCTRRKRRCVKPRKICRVGDKCILIKPRRKPVCRGRAKCILIKPRRKPVCRGRAKCIFKKPRRKPVCRGKNKNFISRIVDTLIRRRQPRKRPKARNTCQYSCKTCLGSLKRRRTTNRRTSRRAKKGGICSFFSKILNCQFDGRGKRKKKHCINERRNRKCARKRRTKPKISTKYLHTVDKCLAKRDTESRKRSFKTSAEKAKFDRCSLCKNCGRELSTKTEYKMSRKGSENSTEQRRKCKKLKSFDDNENKEDSCALEAAERPNDKSCDASFSQVPLCGFFSTCIIPVNRNKNRLNKRENLQQDGREHKRQKVERFEKDVSEDSVVDTFYNLRCRDKNVNKAKSSERLRSSVSDSNSRETTCDEALLKDNKPLRKRCGGMNQTVVVNRVTCDHGSPFPENLETTRSSADSISGPSTSRGVISPRKSKSGSEDKSQTVVVSRVTCDHGTPFPENLETTRSSADSTSGPSTSRGVISPRKSKSGSKDKSVPRSNDSSAPKKQSLHSESVANSEPSLTETARKSKSRSKDKYIPKKVESSVSKKRCKVYLSRRQKVDDLNNAIDVLRVCRRKPRKNKCKVLLGQGRRGRSNSDEKQIKQEAIVETSKNKYENLRRSPRRKINDLTAVQSSEQNTADESNATKTDSEQCITSTEDTDKSKKSEDCPSTSDSSTQESDKIQTVADPDKPDQSTQAPSEDVVQILQHSPYIS